mmetsp:Transcript_123838/g.350640  ORF Transcript_123838/g.350640 Transcript_123838/m.350640 type:complete len:220 (+) Transcript_123838:321-980(+)
MLTLRNSLTISISASGTCLITSCACTAGTSTTLSTRRICGTSTIFSTVWGWICGTSCTISWTWTTGTCLITSWYCTCGTSTILSWHWSWGTSTTLSTVSICETSPADSTPFSSNSPASWLVTCAAAPAPASSSPPNPGGQGRSARIIRIRARRRRSLLRTVRQALTVPVRPPRAPAGRAAAATSSPRVSGGARERTGPLAEGAGPLPALGYHRGCSAAS